MQSDDLRHWKKHSTGLGTKFKTYALAEAASPDGLTWDRGADQENVSLTLQPGEWDGGMIGYPCVLPQDGKLHLFYNGSGGGGTGIGMAVATMREHDSGPENTMTRLSILLWTLISTATTQAAQRQTDDMSVDRVHSKLFRHQSTIHDHEFCGSEVCVDFDGDGHVEIVKSVDNYKQDGAHEGIFSSREFNVSCAAFVMADCSANGPSLGGSITLSVGPRGEKPTWDVQTQAVHNGLLRLEVPAGELGSLQEFDVYVTLHSSSGVENGDKACATLSKLTIQAKGE